MAGYPSRISLTLISSCFFALSLIWYSRKRKFPFLQRLIKDFGLRDNSPEINTRGDKAVDALVTSMNLREQEPQEAGLAQQIPCLSETPGTMHLKDKSQDFVVDNAVKEDVALNGSTMKKTCNGNRHDGENGATCDSAARTNGITTNGACDKASDKKDCSVSNKSGEHCKANGCEIIHETNGCEAIHEANGCGTISSLTNGVDTLCLDEDIIVVQDMPNGQTNGDAVHTKTTGPSQNPEYEPPHTMNISADTCLIAQLSASPDNLPSLADFTDGNSVELSCQIDFDRKSTTPDSGVSAELQCQSPCSTLSEPHSDSPLNGTESSKSPAVSESSNSCGNETHDDSYDVDGATPSCSYEVDGATPSCSYDVDGATAACSYDIDGATASCSYDVGGATASCSYDVDGATSSCSYDVDGATASCSYDVDGATASCSYDVDGVTASSSAGAYPDPVPHEDGYLEYDFEIPQKFCGYLIGKGGRNVKYLINTSNASIMVNSHPVYKDMKMCRVTGTEEEIKHALTLIRKKFPLDNYPLLTLQSMNPIQTECTLPVTSQLSLPPGINFDVILSSTVNPSHIFLQQPTHPTYHNLMYFTEIMDAWYSEFEAPKPFNVSINHVVVVPAGTGWFRAQVVDLFPETDECTVKFLDYGGYSTVPLAQLRQLRLEYSYVPFQASECYLANITYPEGESEWSDEAKKAFEELAMGQIIHGYIVGYKGAIPYVHLYCVRDGQTIFISQKLVSEGHARWISLDES